MLFGLVNGLAAVGTFFAIYRSAPRDFGWFAYAPLDEEVAYDYYYDFPWEYVVVPCVLLVLNVLLLPLVVRRGWLS